LDSSVLGEVAIRIELISWIVERFDADCLWLLATAERRMIDT